MVHGGPDAPAVDIYAGDALLVENIAFGELSGAVLRLQEAADGRRNWTGRQPDQQLEAAATPAIASLPRVNAFTATGLRVLVSRPAFTRPTEVVIDTADFGIRDGLFWSRMSAPTASFSVEIRQPDCARG